MNEGIEIIDIIFPPANTGEGESIMNMNNAKEERNEDEKLFPFPFSFHLLASFHLKINKSLFNKFSFWPY
jgi:hypothetical protein